MASTVLLLLIALLGPTTDVLDMLVQSLFAYFVEMPSLMFYTGECVCVWCVVCDDDDAMCVFCIL